MPWKDTLIPRQKFCSLQRTCAENDRPLRGAEHFQTRPLPGAQPLQPQPQRRRSHIVPLGMTKEMLICIRRITKCLLILPACLNKPEHEELPRKLAKAFGYAAHQPGSRKHQRDVLAEFAIKAARTGSENQGGQCLTLKAPQSLNSLCAHVPRPVRHNQSEAKQLPALSPKPASTTPCFLQVVPH